MKIPIAAYKLHLTDGTIRVDPPAHARVSVCFIDVFSYAHSSTQLMTSLTNAKILSHGLSSVGRWVDIIFMTQ